MIIELASVPIRPKAVELTLEPGDVELDVDGVTLTDRVAFVGETEKVDDKVHVRGSITGRAEIECIRCLKPVEQLIDVTFDDIFVDETEEPVEAELALGAEDLDIAIAMGGRIDLAEVIREQILLELPDQLICTENCRGLCPKCGSDRNLLDCKCIENEIDPRWSALKDFR